MNFKEVRYNATVNSSGAITGINAGFCLVTATYTDTNGTTNTSYSDSIIAYITIPDGEYTLKNLKSNKVVDIFDAHSAPQTNVIQKEIGSSVFPHQVWKISYIGEGKYFVQIALDFEYVNGADGLTPNYADVNMVNMIYHDNISRSEFTSLLGTTTGDVMIRTHGSPTGLDTNNIETDFNTSTIGDVTASVVIYGACSCGEGGDTNPNNLVNVTASKAYACGNNDVIVVGFLRNVYTTHANDLMEQFIKYTRSGLSYEAALKEIDRYFPLGDYQKQLYIVGVELSDN